MISFDRDFPFDFEYKTRHVTSTVESFFVDAENLVSLFPTTEMVLDFVIVVFGIRSSRKLNFDMTT